MHRRQAKRAHWRQASRLGRTLTRLALLPWISVLLLLALLLAADTDAGRDLIARASSAASGGQVALRGLHGELPWRPRVERLELADADGVWLRAHDVRLTLHPASLLQGELDIRALTVDRLALLRVPVSATDDTGGSRLPLALRLRQLVIARLLLAMLDPAPPPLSVTGSVRLAHRQNVADLRLTVPQRDDDYRLTLAPTAAGPRLAVSINEGADGPLALLASTSGVRLPAGLADWTLSAELEGPPDAALVRAEFAGGPYRGSAKGRIDLAAEQIAALDVELKIGSADKLPWGRLGQVNWEGITAQIGLEGPLRALQGTLRAHAAGVELGPVATELRLDGGFDLARSPRISGGLVAALNRVPQPWADQLGDALRLTFSAGQDGAAWRIDQGRIQAERLDLMLAGLLGGEALDLSWTLRLRAPDLLGDPVGLVVEAQGSASGSPRSPHLDARLDLSRSAPAGPAAALGGTAADRAQGRLELTPASLQGRLTLNGRWLGAPLGLDLEMAPVAAGGLGFQLADGRWVGIDVAGALDLATGAALPRGELRLAIDQLGATAPLLVPLLRERFVPGASADWPRDLGGRLHARLLMDGDESIRVTVDGSDLHLSHGMRLGTLGLDGELRRPLGAARGKARLHVADLTVGGLSGHLDVRAEGAPSALDMDAAARLRLVQSEVADPLDVQLSAAARLDLDARRLALRGLRLDARDRQLALMAPGAIDFSNGVRLEPLRLGLSAESAVASSGMLELAGRITPSLDLDAKLAGLDLPALAPLLPSMPAGLEGVLEGDARLRGSVTAPTGEVRLRAGGLGLARAVRLGLPRADARLTLTLEGASTGLAFEAGMQEGARLDLDGRIGGPVWSADAPLALRGRGRVDLALLDAWLSAAGRRAEGRIALDAAIGGSRIAPRLDGRLGIVDGAWRDRRLGLWLDDIQGEARLRGVGLRIKRLTARAGDGSLALDGGIDLLAPGRPLDLSLRARAAEPVQLDLISLRGDADLGLRGELVGGLDLIGDLRFAAVTIRVPERLPLDVPTLDVIEVGERRQPRPVRRPSGAGAWPARLGLDLRIDAPGAVQVRGRGIDAELGGTVRLRGTAAAPLTEGGFELLRGEYELVGQPLRFSRGRIGLDGGHLLDPTLDLEARTQGPGATATLAIEGRARTPRVVLRGEPPMPDDEVLSRLLFGVPPSRLSGLQLTRLGLAAASVAGLDLDGSDLLSRMRSGLGLERLRIDNDRRGGAVLEGGRDLGERVYLGARQRLERGDPRAVFGLRLAPQIRFESDLGASGAGAGAAFELEY